MPLRFLLTPYTRRGLTLLGKNGLLNASADFFWFMFLLLITGQISIMTMPPRDHPLFPPQFPANWAVEWGEDGFGLFMVLEVKGVQQRFRWLLPGTFLMGSPEGEPERWNGETLHRVTLSQGFWLADTACTQALWQAVTGENPSSFNEDGNNPVENVSWHDAQAFNLKLNSLFPELAARLPTEAEWEYACRAGTVTPFSFGENITPEQVNYNGNHPYNNGPKGLYQGKNRAGKIPAGQPLGFV